MIFDEKVIHVALESGFNSYDGFLRKFGIVPQKYQTETPPANWFVHYPIEAGYILKEGRKEMPKEPVKQAMTVTAVERPARKLILVCSVDAAEYFSFCEEMGCEWEGLFNSVSEKFDTPALLTLPKKSYHQWDRQYCFRCGSSSEL